MAAFRLPFRSRRSPFGSQSGMSMASVLVGMALGVAVVAAVAQTLTSSMKRMQAVVEAADLRDMRLHLQSATDCSNTKATYSCGGYIGLVDKSNRTLVARFNSRSPQRMGPYAIRASCDSGTVTVEFTKGDGIKDSDWKSVFPPAVPFSCRY